ncbi:MAG TPA: LLM class flavin-dependent oxidoreductase, partial [Candidatus Thalassarchaeum sp.]|nr:LLM class flavin-dependent oxidoreductase [Candidatus Thalassarchaeum sp.]
MRLRFDIFFSIAQTPDMTGRTPSEREMFASFFEQVELADKLGFGVGWVAQAHLSTEVQKGNSKPVVPHFPGEVGLCTDFFQVAGQMLSRTERMEVGSAVMSILASGGPIAQAERVGAFLALHGMNPSESRRLHIGFSAGRFEFMARPYGIVPRDTVEAAAWPALRGQIFAEASEIFLRLLNGEVLSSDMTKPTILNRSNFRSDGDWENVQDAAVSLRSLNSAPDSIEIARRYEFEDIKTIPQEWRRELLN